MKLKIEIGLGNTAFQGGQAGREVSIILGRFAHIIRDMDGAGLIQFLNGGIGQGHALKDTNGNTVGRAFYTLTIEDREEGDGSRDCEHQSGLSRCAICEEEG